MKIIKGTPSSNSSDNEDLTHSVTVILEEKTELLFTKVDLGENSDFLAGHSILEEFNGDQLTVDGLKTSDDSFLHAAQNGGEKMRIERRSSRRHDFRLQVILLSPQKSFRTFTDNISISGMMLEDVIPEEYLNQVFDIVIIRKSKLQNFAEKIAFTAKVVGDLRDRRRIAITSYQHRSKERLSEMLHKYEKEATAR
jgi:hypothetical protein